MLQPPGVPKKTLWISYIISGIPVFLLLMSGFMKLVKPPSVVNGFAEYGFSDGLIAPLGILEIFCTVIYLIPRTSVLGSILLTGYFGGVICTNLRVGKDVIMPTILGVLIWGGLYLRVRRMRDLIPIKRG